MSDSSEKVVLHIKGLDKFMAKMSDARSAVIHKILTQWSFIYLSWSQLRFVKASEGDGTWPPLSPATIARRRQGKNTSTGTSTKILRDTSTLFNALTPGITMPGSLRVEEGFGILLGYGGSGGHPSSKKATIAQIAEFHQVGGGHLPQRKIIVVPPQEVIEKMTKIAETELQKELSKDLS